MKVPALLATALLLAVAAAPIASADATDTISDDLRGQLSSAVSQWLKQQAEGSDNAAGNPTKRGYYSRTFRPAADGSYQVTAHLETAESTVKTTQRYLLTLKKDGGKWTVGDATVEDTYEGMRRISHAACQPFDSFAFDHEGLHLSGGKGSVCTGYLEGSPSAFWVNAEGATYHYEPPDYALALHLLPDFHSVFETVKKDHTSELEFSPAGFVFGCDAGTCADLLSESFTGLGPLQPEPPASGFGEVPDWAEPWVGQLLKDISDNPFAGFSRLDVPGHRYYSVFVARAIDPFTYPGFEPGVVDVAGSLPGPGVQLSYNNWGGFEVEFNVWPRRLDNPDQLFGTIYGYYTEETLKTTDPYSIEKRDDMATRWHQVYSVKGTVDMGVSDPTGEMLEADIEFGIELKQPVRELPFQIQAIPRREFTGKDKSRELYVNSVQLDGQELTWTRTSQLGGLVILPEEMPAGSKIKLRMNFKTRAMYKLNYAFTYVSRFGWMPFVSFGDFIDEFELTVRTPDKYKVLGIGKQVDEHKDGNTVVTRWVAENPVVFPSMAMGRYQQDDAGKNFQPAKKLDGTPIPVTVHVDEASFNQWGISPRSLRPIAQQAINSINLYEQLSGLDYPYGELNFVNDPQGFLYGQAPSSLIYLGSGVFRGEGFLAAALGGGTNATGIAKFLKSVVAHEVGHQWWGSRVSNANERNYWFVETLAEYFSALYLEGVYGKKEYDEQVDEWRRTILDRDLKASVQNASTIWSGEGANGSPYQAAVYNKGPMAFHMLRQIFGDEKFFPFLKQFSQELAQKREIVTLDIERAAESGLGGIGEDGQPYNVDLDWFFTQWIRGSGIPQFRFTYDTRQAEDGGWLIEGVVEQRVVVGDKRGLEVLDGTYYKGIVDVTVTTKDNEFAKRLVVDGKETPFRLKVPAKPVLVALNKNNAILAHDNVVNQTW